jgi:UDP-N-acetyl-D-glucosamine dehydrogenase
VATRFIDLAEDVNLHMPDYVASRVFEALNERGLPVLGTRILAVGVAYKRNVADDRESPAIDVMERLERRGAKLGVLDPYVLPERLTRFGHEVVDAAADLSSWDMAVILTDHDGVDYARLAADVDLVFDTRGAYRRLGLAADNVLTL